MTAATGRRARQLVGRYRDREGVEHRVLVQHSPDTWVISDEAGDDRPQLVDRLCGEDESRLTAEAVARDWIAQHSKSA
jgi:hypothetical protein